MSPQIQARHVLMVRLDNMGDVLMCTPAMQALRASYPHARLTLLTSPAGALLNGHLGMVDDVLVHRASWVKQASEMDSEWALVERLREREIDFAVIFTTATQSALPMAMLCRMANIPHCLGYSRENPYALLQPWVQEADLVGPGMRHEVQRQLDLLAGAGIVPPADVSLRFDVHEVDRLRAKEALRHAGVQARQPYVLVHPGASALSRRYPVQSFAATMDLLDQVGLQCVLCGGSQDHEVMDAVWDMRKSGAMVRLAEKGVGVLGALIEGASLLIANNSGPAHLAAAVGTPLVCLYALTNPQHTPWQVATRVLFQNVPCRDCLSSRCRNATHACLSGVTPEAVVEAALSLLRDKAHARVA